MSSTTPLKVGLIGYGHWGPNYARVLNALPESDLTWVIDPDPIALKKAKSAYPHIKTSHDSQLLFNDETTPLVIIASPGSTHFKLSQAALTNGKDVLCEKPLALCPEESHSLTQLTKEHKKILMVGHIYLFHPTFLNLKQRMLSGQMGDIKRIIATRTNLGPVRHDLGVLDDLIIHDLSMLYHLYQTQPEILSAVGQRSFGAKQVDSAHISLSYPSGCQVQLHASWFYPVKTRQWVVVGTHEMALWDELKPEFPLCITPFSQTPPLETWPKTLPQIEMGPFQDEPLASQVKGFIQACHTRHTPESDGPFASQITETLNQLKYQLSKESHHKR